MISFRSTFSDPSNLEALSIEKKGERIGGREGEREHVGREKGNENGESNKGVPMLRLKNKEEREGGRSRDRGGGDGG